MNKARFAAVGVAVAVTGMLAAPAPPSAYDEAMRAAMAPYYAALLASARRDREGTQRQLLLLAARWRDAARQGRTGAPPLLVKDPEWAKALDAVTAAVDRARQQVSKSEVARAHGELESIRMTLHAVRARHQLLTFDDRFSEFHEAMEHLTSRVPERYEFRLTEADFKDIREDLDQVKHHWQTVQARADEVRGAQGWAEGVKRMESAIGDTSAALERSDVDALSRGSKAIHDVYFELLSVLSGAA